MIEQAYIPPDPEFELKIQAAFPVPDPDPAFVDRLQREIFDRFEAIGAAYSKPLIPTLDIGLFDRAKSVLTPLAWVAIALLLVLILIWGINNLIPRTVPGVILKGAPSPDITEDNRQTALASPTPTKAPTTDVALSPQLPALQTLSLENAIFYTVLEGDTLASIAGVTDVPVETLQSLNEFVLQLNGLVPGLELLTGFEGQEPVFYTVQQGDTLFGIAEQAGISMEELVTLNRIGVYSPGVATPEGVPHGVLAPGMSVIIGLENTGTKKTQSTGGKQIVFSETDLNCDNQIERIRGIEAPEIEYFDIHPQLSTIILETVTGESAEKAWDYTAQEAGAAYLAFQLFKPDDCDQLLVLLSHKGKEGVRVFRWDGEQMTLVLHHPGRFLFEGDWMEPLFGEYRSSADTLNLGELQQSSTASKNIWILREYRWDGKTLKMIAIRRMESAGGG